MTTQVIFEDQQTYFDILMHNYMNLQTDSLPGTESSEEHEVITFTASDSSVDLPTISETERADPEPPRKARKTDISPKKSEEVHSKTAKALELLLGKTCEVSELDRLKQTIAKNPKAHYYRKKYDTLRGNIQTRVLGELRSLKNQLKEWDVAFLASNSRLPSDSDYSNDRQFKELSKKKKSGLKAP